MRLTTTTALVALSTAAALGACSDPGPDAQCSGKCDQLGDFASQLDGRNDAIAQFLREANIGADGVASFDYGAVVSGVARLQGCSEDSWKTFVVSDALVEEDTFPRLISTVCSDEPTRAAEFFIAASFKDPEIDDIDPFNIEMFAWDDDAGIYRFYATEPLGGGEVRVEVDPERCTECHLTPTNLPSAGMRMTPIMNELSQPWTHWSSEVPMFNGSGIPFRSDDFDVPMNVRGAGNFLRYGSQKIGAAQEFEFIIREGHAKVALQRARERRERSDGWNDAMNLLRPVFCAEQVNYSSEDFDSGKLHFSTVIPGGLSEAYRALRPDDWPWQWVNNGDGRMRLPAPAGEPTLSMVPVRGNADVDYETRLVTGRTLTPHQVMRVRALDWKRPVFSEFRCGLWMSASERLASDPPVIDELSPRDSARMQVLYDYIMQIDGQPIAGATPETIVAVDVVDDPAALASALASGLPAECGPEGEGACAVDHDGFGAILDAYVQSFEQGDPDEVRRRLRAARDQRLCHVQQFFPNAPALPSVSCGASAE